MTRKEKIISFAWQHLLLFVALYIMTLGIAVCVKSMLGASVISVLPYVFHDAGTGGLTPSLTIGQYTFIILLSWLQPETIWEKAVAQLAGCTILAAGIALEVRCGSVTMPGEGFPVAISKVTGIEFPKVKIVVDVSLVLLGIVFCYIFFGKWQWHIIGVGTLFAMYYVGWAVRIASHHLKWFDRLLKYRPGFRRYIYGLARYIYRK